MDANRAQGKIQLILEHNQIRFRLRFVLSHQLAHRQPAQVHVGFRLSQKNRF